MNRFATLCTLALAIFAGPGAHAQPEIQLVRIIDYPGTGNTIARVAIAKKLCEKHGLQCELRTVNTGPLAVQVLLAGEVQVAYAPAEVAIQAALQGAQLKIIGAGYSPPPFFLAVGNHVELPNAAKGYPEALRDLKGKKVGVPARGTAGEFSLKAMLQDAGMSANDVVIVPVGAPNTAYPSLVNKQIDAAVSFEPMAGFCKVLNTCKVVVDMRVGQGPAGIVATTGASTPLIVKADFAQKNPKTIAAISRVMRDAAAFVQAPENFAEYVAIIEEKFKIDHPQGRAIIESTARATALGVRFENNPTALQAVARYLHETGQTPTLFDTKALLIAP